MTAPQATVEAAMYDLRERGVLALTEPAVKRRLAQLSDDQLFEVGNRLQRLKPQIARPWTADEVKQLLRSR
jgi:transposase